MWCKCAGPLKCEALRTAVRGGKTNKEGRVELSELIRHQDPVVCAISALGRHLVREFTLDQVCTCLGWSDFWGCGSAAMMDVPVWAAET